MKTTLGTLNRTRTAMAGTLTSEQLERPLALRNAARKTGVDAQTFEFMTNEEIAAYRNNVIEAIERNEGKLNGTIRSGGIPHAILNDHIVELLIILEGVDARLDEIEAEAAQPSTNQLETFFEGLTPKEEKVLRAILKHSECEYGLPCDKEAVAKDSGVKGKALSGVVSSLVKKGLVECYDFDYYYGEFFASEELFEAYNAE